jgi:hypothetical protein
MKVKGGRRREREKIKERRNRNGTYKLLKKLRDSQLRNPILSGTVPRERLYSKHKSP